jgi:hypothetical protein
MADSDRLWPDVRDDILAYESRQPAQRGMANCAPRSGPDLALPPSPVCTLETFGLKTCERGRTPWQESSGNDEVYLLFRRALSIRHDVF